MPESSDFIQEETHTLVNELEIRARTQLIPNLYVFNFVRIFLIFDLQDMPVENLGRQVLIFEPVKDALVTLLYHLCDHGALSVGIHTSEVREAAQGYLHGFI
jgi:hypothetical protein